MIDHRLRPYATVYPFFSEKLCLHGSEMLVFAVIFGFWKKRREPVPISYRRIREVMGLSRSTVGKAIQVLLARGLIDNSTSSRGKPSRYTVILPDGIPESEWNGSRQRKGYPPVRESSGHPSETKSPTRPISGPHNKKDIGRNIRYHKDEKRNTGPIDIPDPAEFDGDDSW